MKATGIVRRIEECGIITPRAIKPYKHGFWAIYEEKFLTKNSIFKSIHSKKHPV